MTYLHPPGGSGDGTRGGDLRPDRARHGGTAPEPYPGEPYPPGQYPGEQYQSEPYPGESYGPGRYPDEPWPDPYPGERYDAVPPGERYDAVPPGGRYDPAPYPGEAYDPAPYPGGHYGEPVYGEPVVPVAAAGGPDPLAFEDQTRTAEPRLSRAERRRADDAEWRSDTGRRSGRAGRDLPAAIGVGVGLVAIVLGSLYFFKPAFLAVVMLAAAVGIWEMARAVRPHAAHPPLTPLLAGGAVMLALAWLEGPAGLALGLLVTVLAAMVWRLSDGPAGFQADVTSAALIAVYVPFLAGFAVLLAVPDDGDRRVLVTLAAVVLSDTGGYAAGVRFGRRQMAPTISPKKSWEGLAGSLAAAAVGSAVLLYYLLDLAPWWGAIFGLAVSIAAVLGDLAESMIKRDLGVKDMSNILPGHGGLMDRLDSILFAVPTAFLVLALLLPSAG